MRVGHTGRGHRKRLKERFDRAGIGALHDHEILELALTLAIPRRDVKLAAKALLARFGSLRGVFAASRAELAEAEGIGDAASFLLQFLHALHVRLLLDRSREAGPVLGTPRAVLDLLGAEMSGLRDEVFRVLFLDAKNHLLASEDLHRGTVNETAVYPRKLAERAIARNAVSVILAHNHPSGNPTPSPEDRLLTERLVAALDALEIRVHDHIVIGRNRHFSFRESGLLARRA